VDVEKHGPAASSGPALVLVIQALFNDRKRLKGNLLFIVLPDNRK
jgi:arginine utilization protein RocB